MALLGPGPQCDKGTAFQNLRIAPTWSGGPFSSMSQLTKVFSVNKKGFSLPAGVAIAEFCC